MLSCCRTFTQQTNSIRYPLVSRFSTLCLIIGTTVSRTLPGHLEERDTVTSTPLCQNVLQHTHFPRPHTLFISGQTTPFPRRITLVATSLSARTSTLCAVQRAYPRGPAHNWRSDRALRLSCNDNARCCRQIHSTHHWPRTARLKSTSCCSALLFTRSRGAQNLSLPPTSPLKHHGASSISPVYALLRALTQTRLPPLAPTTLLANGQRPHLIPALSCRSRTTYHTRVHSLTTLALRHVSSRRATSPPPHRRQGGGGCKPAFPKTNHPGGS